MYFRFIREKEGLSDLFSFQSQYRSFSVIQQFLLHEVSEEICPQVGHMTLDHGIGVRIPASQPPLISRAISGKLSIPERFPK